MHVCVCTSHGPHRNQKTILTNLWVSLNVSAMLCWTCQAAVLRALRPSDHCPASVGLVGLMHSNGYHWYSFYLLLLLMWIPQIDPSHLACVASTFLLNHFARPIYFNSSFWRFFINDKISLQWQKTGHGYFICLSPFSAPIGCPWLFLKFLLAFICLKSRHSFSLDF